MRKVTVFAMALAILFCGTTVTYAAETEDLTSLSATAQPEGVFGEGCGAVLLMEQRTGTVLYESKADEKLPIASVTKVMTLLLVVEAIDSGKISKTDLVTISENAASKGGSQIYLEVGETMSVQDLLKAVVVASANDGAVALGEFVSGSEAAFVADMTRRAKELGLDVEFVNPTGLDDDGCHTLSARDVAIISRELLSHEWITEYTTIWMDSVRDGAFGLTNTNRLVRFYEGTTGLKTGSTSKAKFCISASAKRQNLHLIAVVLGGETSERRFAAAKELLDFGFANYALYEPQAESFSDIRVLGAKTPTVKPVRKGEGILISKSDLSKVTEEVMLPETLNAPVEQGQTIGEIVYRVGDNEVARHPILAETQVEKADFGFLFRKLFGALFFAG